jgi:hypothetical protein
MINGQHYTYIDAVLVLVPRAKFYPSSTGVYEDAEWVDERPAPSSEEVAAKLAELVSQEGLFFLRRERNKRLAESDWAGLEDVPESVKLKWRTYRQNLRDITKHYSSLEDAVFPAKPE